MPKATLATFGSQVNSFRKNKTLRVAAKEIGISAPTLMRVESGRIPDVETFGKLCKWMNVDPNLYLGTKVDNATSPEALEGPLVISAHFRADRLPKPETAQALAKMILFAVSRQQTSESLDGT
jgi:transcriptional regulator with XRE-family HTH domain